MKKRVLHLLASNKFSGAENVVCTMIKNNDEYDMFYCSLEGDICNTLKQKNINFIKLDKLSPFCVKKICDKYNIDILHAHDMKASFIAGLSGFKGKIISQLHGRFSFNDKWNIYSIAYSIVMKKFYKIIVVSEEVKNNAIFFKNNFDKVIVLDNVVDKTDVVSKSIEFKSKKYDLVFLGRLTEVKRPLWPLQIINRLREKYPKIKLCMVGDGDLREECENYINTHNLKENVDILGFQSNPFPYVLNSKVAILTSKHEGLPMSVIECMILGVPVFNTGVDGLGIAFRDYPNFICNNIDEFVIKLDEVLSTKIDFNKECKSIIKKYTDMKSYISVLNEIYK